MMGSSGHDLPTALVEDILSRLPVESLVRFRCVSKSWLALLKESTFISLHLSRSMKRNSNYLVRFWECPYYNKPYSLSIKEDGGFSLEQVNIPYVNSMAHLEASNSCNGIMCFYANKPSCPKGLDTVDCPCAKGVVALCNPTTGELRFLPQSHMISEISDGEVLSAGMGYDYGTNDYRVVRMWKNRRGYYERYIVEEYALSTDSWRRIDSSNPSLLCEYDGIGFATQYKGVYYWWTRQKDRLVTLLTLNVGGGAFQKVPLPRLINTLHPRLLGVLNGFVSLVCPNTCSCEFAYSIWDIWVMDGVDANGSCWTKLKSITAEVCAPLCFWNGNELLIYFGNKLRSYNIDTEEIQNLIVETVDGQQITKAYIIINYVKSLVSIKGGN